MGAALYESVIGFHNLDLFYLFVVAAVCITLETSFSLARFFKNKPAVGRKRSLASCTPHA